MSICDLELELGKEHGQDELNLEEGKILPEAKPVTGVEGGELVLAGVLEAAPLADEEPMGKSENGGAKEVSNEACRTCLCMSCLSVHVVIQSIITLSA